MASFPGEYFDYYQEIARSAFADMLHDHERNHKYYLALKKAIERMHERGLRANVLDIGTGTAILSMMAVKCGADSVTACEAFRPMADAAERIIEHNGMSESIRMIKKRSTDIRVGDGADDLWQRANILVTEVFDTELIGEGAIETFNAAHLHLLETDCIVVPDSATIYVQTVESPLAWAWNQPKLIASLEGEVLLRTPTEIAECKGTAELHDIQLNQFPTHQFRELIPPTAVFEFDFSGKRAIPKDQRRRIPVRSQANGSAQAFFMWWVLKMDQEGELRIDCAPHWAHEDFERLKCEQPAHLPIQNVIPWRDHWMQAVFYNPKALHLNADESLELQCSRDEFSLWFELTHPNDDSNSKIDGERPLCTCGFHLAYSRTRIGQMNDNLRTKKLLRILETEINEKSTVLFVSDGSLIGLAVAALKARHVHLLDANKYTREVLQKYIDFNKLDNVSLIADVDDECIDWRRLTHIIGEPNFSTAIVPWDNFRFGDVIDRIMSRIDSNDVKILPKSASIEAIPIECLDLQKIIAPFGICETFDLTIFDKIIEVSIRSTLTVCLDHVLN